MQTLIYHRSDEDDGVAEEGEEVIQLHGCILAQFIFNRNLLYNVYMPKSINIHILSSSAGIRPYAEQLRSVAQSTVESVERLLPIKDVDIVIYDNPTSALDEVGGIGGFTPNAHVIFISLNPQYRDFKKAINDELPFTLAHELHHTIRWQKQVKGDTLLEALVFEGLSEHFAQELTGRTNPSPWAQALTREQKDIYSLKAKETWSKPTYNNALWFFGSNPELVPRWAGYTIGYDLVEEYLQANPDKKASTLATMDASVFI